MAKPTKKSATSTKVTRIKASDAGDKKAKTAPAITKTPSRKDRAESAVAAKLSKPKNSPSKAEVAQQKALKREARASSRNPFVRFVEYFKGAWYELRQVRWPNRAETWKMTGALLAFTAFFVAIILLLDMLFKYLFEMIIA